MIEHVSLRSSDPKKSRAFYEKALAPLGYVVDKKYGDAFGFMQGGRHDFWVTAGKPGSPVHLAFLAEDTDGVDAFYEAALAAGGKDNGGPGMREDYGYAAFVFDRDGNNIEAVCWEPKAPKRRKPARRSSAQAKTPRKRRSAAH